ncbi:energy-coupling factor transporter transmembrane component T [Leifsonia sp. 2MCAF36]|uniref:energy-coupling factor transporter transmembrane component T n=1 Tax=Leifsonia sp. 2MCAF36 TaxID=3232988 RepID=UPI003F98622A
MTASARVSTASQRAFLNRLNPLAKVAAVVPGWIALVFTRDLVTSLLLLTGSVVLLLVGARLRPSTLLVLLVGVPAGVLVMSAGFALWAHPDPSADPTVVVSAGPVQLTAGALLVGLAGGLRLAAVFGLALIGGLTTSGPELARALTAQLRVPYRFAYTAVAAYRFVPRSAAELTLIRHALRVRGAGAGRGPLAPVRRMAAPLLPLLASSIRHADRVALAMESRAFGAHPRRTERVPMRWRSADTVFVVVAWMLTLGVLLVR